VVAAVDGAIWCNPEATIRCASQEQLIQELRELGRPRYGTPHNKLHLTAAALHKIELHSLTGAAAGEFDRSQRSFANTFRLQKTLAVVRR
jgi:hypothetical protein